MSWFALYICFTEFSWQIFEEEINLLMDKKKTKKNCTLSGSNHKQVSCMEHLLCVWCWATWFLCIISFYPHYIWTELRILLFSGVAGIPWKLLLKSSTCLWSIKFNRKHYFKYQKTRLYYGGEINWSGFLKIKHKN